MSLARAFGTALNITATSLDSQATLVNNYTEAEANLKELKDLCCTILHKVDRIVFNFPHAGFIFRENTDYMIELHKKLVRGFLRNARDMLKTNGEIHKRAYPFSKWNIEELGSENGLRLVGETEFYRWQYRGYMNKRGSGAKCNETFPVGLASTFKFADVSAV
ncbi:Ferredoxin-fold anticodon-binding domain protein [Heracleum sosnowskyi]|uniref:Ferredoxin-fold anticodon-binding domain protein n=1 Tax=Heracleum sosnowskyi TaxID=360622 RepID=A0AAD8N289_9APIA|nr:Ferredoxin-fold anticodon-binding domain protein [Heracleum sosnowskyi]